MIEDRFLLDPRQLLSISQGRRLLIIPFVLLQARSLRYKETEVFMNYTHKGCREARLKTHCLNASIPTLWTVITYAP